MNIKLYHFIKFISSYLNNLLSKLICMPYNTNFLSRICSATMQSLHKPWKISYVYHINHLKQLDVSYYILYNLLKWNIHANLFNMWRIWWCYLDKVLRGLTSVYKFLSSLYIMYFLCSIISFFITYNMYVNVLLYFVSWSYGNMLNY